MQLFDIFNDPFETENLANSNPEIVQELKEIIDSGTVTNKAKIGIFKASSEDEKIYLED